MGEIQLTQFKGLECALTLGLWYKGPFKSFLYFQEDHSCSILLKASTERMVTC